MVRLFHVYYPIRMLTLFACEALIVMLSFVMALALRFGPDSYLILNYESGWIKVICITILALLCSYYFDLYSPQKLDSAGETYFRLLMVVGVLSLLLAGIGYLDPRFMFGRAVFVIGLSILTLTLFIWRSVFAWMIRQPILQERVYVVGNSERAEALIKLLRSRSDLGMQVVGWDDRAVPEFTQHLQLLRRSNIDRIIVALGDRRGTMPVRELLKARVSGISVEEAGVLLEKINGKIELDGLHPSSLIFSDGFRLNHTSVLIRRSVSFSISLLALLICVPIIPIVAVAVKLSSPGPIFFRQRRVGLNGRPFTVFKFRSMRQDAEKQTGAVWAKKDDPRVTRIGAFLRKSRLDEIPQLWNVLKGDMSFVGPRPERPEFVEWLSEKIPYYPLRNIVPPGITGWAQVRYEYGASPEQCREKLAYDLYYIKHMSLALDMLIMFETIKTIVLRRGAQ